jgi:hypothetical protein
MVPDDPKAHVFEVSFADLKNCEATFHTLSKEWRTNGKMCLNNLYGIGLDFNMTSKIKKWKTMMPVLICVKTTSCLLASFV